MSVPRKKSARPSALGASSEGRGVERTRRAVTPMVGAASHAAPLAVAALALLGCGGTTEPVEGPVSGHDCARPGFVAPSATPYILGGYMPVPKPFPPPSPESSIQIPSVLCAALRPDTPPSPIRDLLVASCPPVVGSANPSAAPSASAPPTSPAPSAPKSP